MRLELCFRATGSPRVRVFRWCRGLRLSARSSPGDLRGAGRFRILLSQLRRLGSQGPLRQAGQNERRWQGGSVLLSPNLYVGRIGALLGHRIDLPSRIYLIFRDRHGTETLCPTRVRSEQAASQAVFVGLPSEREAKIVARQRGRTMSGASGGSHRDSPVGKLRD